MILIVTFPDNTHVGSVLPHLERPHHIVDIASIPTVSRLRAHFGRRSSSLELDLGEIRIRPQDVTAVWYRRLRPMELPPTLADERSRALVHSEWTQAIGGLWSCLDHALWMNAPFADEKASHKMWQLQLAPQLGLDIPETLITNDPDAARKFIHRHGVDGTVHKVFRNIAQAPRETLPVTVDDLALLPSVSLAPVIFQERIEARIDLRATVVGDQVLCAAFELERDGCVDYRSAIAEATVYPYQLPEPVEQAVVALVRKLGIVYGAVDLRLTPEGRHVFLEVNPAGEFLYAASGAGLPVPQLIAGMLSQ